MGLEGTRVLVIEDNETIQDIMASYFRRLGLLPDSALDGREGLRKYSEGPEGYDIIFIDAQMPLMDGFEAARRIRASGLPNAKSIPLVLMTGDLVPGDEDEGLFNHHLRKPFEVGKLAELIGALL